MARFYKQTLRGSNVREINLDEIEEAERNGGSITITYRSGRTRKLTGDDADDCLSCIRSSRAKPRGPERTTDKRGRRIVE